MSSALVSYTSPEELANIQASAQAANLNVHITNTTLVDVFSLDAEAVTRWLAENPSLEVDVAPIIMAPRIQRRLVAADLALKPNSTNVPYFYMNQIASIYNVPAPTNAPVCVAVVSFGGGLYGSVDSNGVLTNGDVQAYWSAIGIATVNQPKVIIVALPGASNSPNANDGGSTMENTLDVETIGGACPTSNLTIIMYIAPNNLATFPTLLNYIYSTPVVINSTTYRPSIVSISWGAPEIYYGSSLISSINSQLSTMTAAGMNVCVATGDNGSNDGVGGSANYVDYPSSSPYATAVGGTSLICPNNVYDISTIESAWSTGGGGVSTQNPKPSYQSALNVTGRSTPDIAAIADPNTGVVFTINGSYVQVGGTSVAAPVVASFLAAINYQGFINPKLYTANANCYHDITSGNNGSFSAKTGYDNCTGFGSFNGTTLSAFLSPIIQITALSTSPTSVNVSAGQTATVTPVYTPNNASNKTLTWSSLNTGIATVSSAGVITGVSAGTTTVNATTTDGSNITASVSVTVPAANVPVSSVTLNVSTLTLHVPSTSQLTTTVSPVNATTKTVTWTTSNANVATVSNSGLVTATGVGSAQITVTTTSGSKTAKTTVNVTVPVASITLSAASVSLSTNQTVTLVTTVLPSNAGNKAVTWSSGNNSVATVSSFTINSAVVKGISNGSTTITAQTADMGLIASCSVSVLTKVTGVTLNTSAIALNPTQNSQLTATVSPPTASNKTVTWSSSNTAVATVTTDGLVTAVANGTARITVVTQDGVKQAAVTVTVTTRASGIALSASTLSVRKGFSSPLVATVSPPTASNKAVTWTSNNTLIATVNTNGVVSGIRTGTATITARTTDGGFTATCGVTVP